MCVGRGRSSTYGRSPCSLSAECVRSYIRQNLNDFSPPMAGYPFRLPVRASVQVTSWRGPHFPRRRLNQGCPGTHCPRYRHFVRAEELQTSRVVQSDYDTSGVDAGAYAQHVSGDYARVAVLVPKPTSGLSQRNEDRIIGLARLGWPLVCDWRCMWDRTAPDRGLVVLLRIRRLRIGGR